MRRQDVDRMVKNLFNIAASNPKIVSSIADNRDPYVMQDGRRISALKRGQKYVFKVNNLEITFQIM